jgi:hypothetical protein
LLDPYRASGYARVARLGWPENASSSLPKLIPRWLLVFRGGDTLQQGLVLEHREQGAYDSTWTAVWGPQRRVRDHHRWLRWHLREATGERRLEVEFRVSDEGVAFRCVVPARGLVKYGPGDGRQKPAFR